VVAGRGKRMCMGQQTDGQAGHNDDEGWRSQTAGSRLLKAEGVGSTWPRLLIQHHTNRTRIRCSPLASGLQHVDSSHARSSLASNAPDCRRRRSTVAGASRTVLSRRGGHDYPAASETSCAFQGIDCVPSTGHSLRQNTSFTPSVHLAALACLSLPAEHLKAR
jgi:hypothetical protein